MPVVQFTHYGKPQAKGAHTSFVPRRRDGTLVRKPSGQPLVVTKDSNPRQEADQQSLAAAAHHARLQAGAGITDQPVKVIVDWWFSRPRRHYGTGRNAGQLKATAEPYPHSRATPDIDKLERQLLDALTGTVIRDDCQVVTVAKRKLYAGSNEPPRVDVTVEPVQPALPLEPAGELLSAAR